MTQFKIHEKLILGLILGSVFPLLSGLLAVIAWFYLDRNENHALACLICGLAIGAAIDLKYLKIWIERRYRLSIVFLVVIYLFYNVLIFGFFMGFPVFNLFAGIPAGYYCGKRICHQNMYPEKQTQQIRNVSLFSALVMTIICTVSGYIALAGNGVGHDIQSMFRLGFEVTRPMLWGTIVFGGILLIGLQYVVTSTTMIKTMKGNP